MGLRNGLAMISRHSFKHFGKFNRKPVSLGSMQKAGSTYPRDSQRLSNNFNPKVHHHCRNHCTISRVQPCVSFLQGDSHQQFHPSTISPVYHQSQFSTCSTLLCNNKPQQGETDTETDASQLSIYQRFKRAYKEHGKVLIGVHVVTSSVWISSFYYLVISGIDIVPVIESWNLFSEDKIQHLKSSHAKDFVQAYLMYKLATPARYTVTLLGTNFVIRYFQKIGKMPKASERERLKDLMKDGRQELNTKRMEIDTKIKTRTAGLKSREKKKKTSDQNSS